MWKREIKETKISYDQSDDDGRGSFDQSSSKCVIEMYESVEVK